MKAVINYGYPDGLYVKLPIFDSNPIIKCSPGMYMYHPHTGIVVVGEKAFQEGQKCHDKEYYVYFINDDTGLFNQLRNIWSLNLTEQEIFNINAGYFYLLDHPELEKIEVSLNGI